MPPSLDSLVPTDPPREVSDEALLDALTRGDHHALEDLMRRHNQRLFRLSRAILRDDADAEDALQEAYLHLYRHAGQFRGQSRALTWLSRIVINQSLMRLRQRRARGGPAAMDDGAGPADERAEPPPITVLRAEIRRALERHVDALPRAYRTVFVLREVEDMSGPEVAELLSLPEATVRTRLFRARTLLRAALARELDGTVGDLFGFAGDRCDRIVARVLAAIARDGRAGAFDAARRERAAGAPHRIR